MIKIMTISILVAVVTCLVAKELPFVPLLCVPLLYFLVKDSYSNLETFVMSAVAGSLASVLGIALQLFHEKEPLMNCIGGGVLMSMFAVPFITVGAFLMVLFKPEAK
jgi:hypothetical protein